MDASKLPKWKDMPAVPGMPHGTAWGLFDQNGQKDEVGTLNLLTPSVVIRARQEIQTGRSVALNWGLEKLHEPGFGRAVLNHKIIDWRQKPGYDFYSYDDEITVNTQSGSQWDGLRHWGHSKTGYYYNGTHHDDLLKGSHLGIDFWSKRGGLVGRGVLLDYAAYAERKGISYTPMSKHPITVTDLEAIAKESGVELLAGDILIVRTGWIKWYEENNAEQRRKYITNGKEWAGVEGSEETLEWLWNKHFSAVAGDSIGFELWPAKEECRLHDYLLALWGMPIGEMWDVDGLAEECKRQNRWSFFLTSAPLNTPGGIASPPNAIAIF